MKSSSLPAVKLHQRIGEDLDALDEIERNYNQEITRIFSRFDKLDVMFAAFIHFALIVESLR